MRSWINKLKATSLYESLEWTPLHRFFIRLNNPKYEASQRVELEFYRHLVQPGDLVFDVGANYGSKAEIFLQLGARVIAVEPDEKCGRILRQRFPFNRRFKLVPAALGEKPGTLEFFVQRPGSAYNTASAKWRDHSHVHSKSKVEIPMSTLDELVRRYGRPAFLKIDVEGFEREVLRGLTCSVPALSFEANLPIFREETLECIDMLSRLNVGYLYSLVTDPATGWREPTKTAQEVADLVSQWNGYCEIFAVESALREKRATAGPL